LQELEDSGLSRFEILYDEPNKGILLKDDPFFQLIKTSKTVREMLIPSNADFNADRVVELALR
jgi:hypothetical protein